MLVTGRNIFRMERVVRFAPIEWRFNEIEKLFAAQCPNGRIYFFAG